MQVIANTIAATIGTTTTSLPALTSITVTTGVGFSSDGVTATYTLEKNGSIIKYTTKANTNATLNVTTKDGSQAIPLNFGGKSIINIIQK